MIKIKSLIASVFKQDEKSRLQNDVTDTECGMLVTENSQKITIPSC
jgi:hypothetical protein